MDSESDPKNHFEELMIENPGSVTTNRKIGNIHILYENSKFLFTIGPDCNDLDNFRRLFLYRIYFIHNNELCHCVHCSSSNS